jgi:hypothetical protein
MQTHTEEKQADDRGRSQAQAQLESIREMIDALNAAEEVDDSDAIDAARQTIEEDALSVEVRSGWHSPGGESEPEEYRILLCTGGPAVQIIGDLNEHMEPSRARLMYQDWFTPWQELILDEDGYAALRRYAGVFYFGE